MKNKIGKFSGMAEKPMAQKHEEQRSFSGMAEKLMAQKYEEQ